MRLFFIQCISYGFFLWLINLGLGSYLASYETNDLNENKQFFPTLRWNDFYKEKTSIETLILGSSHAYRAFDPKVIATILDDKKQSVFNFGSSAQSPVNSYFVLKEVLQKHRPKRVVIDLYFMVFTPDYQLRNRRFNWQYMKAGPTKKQFFSEGFSLKEKVLLRLAPAYVFKDYLKAKCNKLLGRTYLLPPRGIYQGAGFVSNPDTLSLDELMNENQFDYFKTETREMTQQNLDYLKKIKELCIAEGITLVFTTAPMPAISVKKIENYKSFYQLFDELAKAWNIPYLDYNTHRIDELNDTAHFYDDDHLNENGARVFSTVFTNDLIKIISQ